MTRAKAWVPFPSAECSCCGSSVDVWTDVQLSTLFMYYEDDPWRCSEGHHGGVQIGGDDCDVAYLGEPVGEDGEPCHVVSREELERE